VEGTQEQKLMLGGEEKQQRKKESRRARNKNPPLFAHRDALVDRTRQQGTAKRRKIVTAQGANEREKEKRTEY
jgi:hypothetical protein